MIRRNLAVLAIVLACALSAWAGPNFTGDWKLAPAKSDFGPMPAPDSAVLKIEHKDPSLKVSTTQSGSNGEQKFDASYNTAGEETTNKMGPVEVKTVAKWDGEELSMTSKIDFNGMDISIKGKWSLSADGKTLTQVSHATSPQGEFDMKAVYEKQEAAK